MLKYFGKPMRTFIAFLLLATTCDAWTGAGHYLIGIIAYDQLPLARQAELIALLQSHPSSRGKLAIPDDVEDSVRWLIGRTATWPDLIRGTPLDRPDWHWEDRASVVLEAGIELPKAMTIVPDGASLETLELHLSQAIQLSTRVFNDKTAARRDRAIAMSWIMHLVGDAHQPCHVGSLYSKGFQTGDRGANEIKTVQRKKLHALWDGLLGTSADQGDIDRRAREIQADAELMTSARANSTDPLDRWIDESAELSRKFVYSDEVLTWVKRVDAVETPDPLQLSEHYLKAAGAVARRQAAIAAFRLAELLK